MKKYNVIFSDLDGTLIKTISGETFPKGIWDMQIRLEVLDKIKEVKPEYLLIVSNQGGIERGFISQSDFSSKIECICTAFGDYKYCIPYNDDTKHLVGTTKEAPEFYRYWED